MATREDDLYRLLVAADPSTAPADPAEQEGDSLYQALVAADPESGVAPPPDPEPETTLPQDDSIPSRVRRALSERITSPLHGFIQENLLDPAAEALGPLSDRALVPTLPGFRPLDPIISSREEQQQQIQQALEQRYLEEAGVEGIAPDVQARIQEVSAGLADEHADPRIFGEGLFEAAMQDPVGVFSETLRALPRSVQNLSADLAGGVVGLVEGRGPDISVPGEGEPRRAVEEPEPGRSRAEAVAEALRSRLPEPETGIGEGAEIATDIGTELAFLIAGSKGTAAGLRRAGGSKALERFPRLARTFRNLGRNPSNRALAASADFLRFIPPDVLLGASPNRERSVAGAFPEHVESAARFVADEVGDAVGGALTDTSGMLGGEDRENPDFSVADMVFGDEGELADEIENNPRVRATAEFIINAAIGVPLAATFSPRRIARLVQSVDPDEVVEIALRRADEQGADFLQNLDERDAAALARAARRVDSEPARAVERGAQARLEQLRASGPTARGDEGHIVLPGPDRPERTIERVREGVEGEGTDFLRRADEEDLTEMRRAAREAEEPQPDIEEAAELTALEREIELTREGEEVLGDGESITRAAVRVGDQVFEGRTHNVAGGVAERELGADALRDMEDGFTTSEGRFVSRAEAMRIADESGQLTDEARVMREEEGIDELSSEELVRDAPAPTGEHIQYPAVLVEGEDIVIGPNHITAQRHAESYLGRPVGTNSMVDGFVTNEGRFVSRSEAMRIAREQGQLADEAFPGDELVTEALNPRTLGASIPEIPRTLVGAGGGAIAGGALPAEDEDERLRNVIGGIVAGTGIGAAGARIVRGLDEAMQGRVSQALRQMRQADDVTRLADDAAPQRGTAVEMGEPVQVNRFSRTPADDATRKALDELHPVQQRVGATDDQGRYLAAPYRVDENGVVISRGTHEEAMERLREMGGENVRPARYWPDDAQIRHPLIGTKIVGKDGKTPARVYHGTPFPFRDFDPARAETGLYTRGPSIYFTENPRVAGNVEGTPGYATAVRSRIRQTITELRRDVEDLTRQADRADDDGATLRELQEARESLARQEELLEQANAPNVRPARLAVSDPLDLREPVTEDVLERLDTGVRIVADDIANTTGIPAEKIHRDIMEDLRGKVFSGRAFDPDLDRALASTLIENGGDRSHIGEIARHSGYDGLTYTGGNFVGGFGEHPVHVVFDRNQVFDAFSAPHRAAQAGHMLPVLSRSLGGGALGAAVAGPIAAEREGGLSGAQGALAGFAAGAGAGAVGGRVARAAAEALEPGGFARMRRAMSNEKAAQAYREASPVQRRLARGEESHAGISLERMGKGLREIRRRTIDEGQPIDDLHELALSDLQELRATARRNGGPSGEVEEAIKELENAVEKYGEELTFVARSVRGAAGLGDRAFWEGPPKELGSIEREEGVRGIGDIVADAGGRRHELEDYLLGRRVQYLEEQGRPEAVPVQYRPGTEQRRHLDEIVETADEQIQGWFGDVQKLNRAWLNLLEQEGILPKGGADKILERNEVWVPLNREILDEELGRSALGAPTGKGQRLPGASGLFKLRGSEKELSVIPPLDTMMRLNYLFSTNVFRQRVYRNLAEMAKAVPDNPHIFKPATSDIVRPVDFMRQLPEEAQKALSDIMGKDPADIVAFTGMGMQPEKRIIRVWNGDEGEYWQLSEGMWDAVMGGTSLNPGTAAAILARGLSFPAKTLRTLVTIMPDFSIRNFTRDTLQTAITSQYTAPGIRGVFQAARDAMGGLAVLFTAAVPSAGRRSLGGAFVGGGIGGITTAPTAKGEDFAGGAKAAAVGIGVGAAIGAGAGAGSRLLANRFLRRMELDEFTPERFIQLWDESGASQAAFQAMDMRSMRDKMERAIARGEDPSTVRNITNPMEVLRAISVATENSNRVAEFARVLRHRGTDPANVLRGGALARDVSIDFSRRGASQVVDVLRPMAAFWNARVQGLDKLRRVLFEKGGEKTRMQAFRTAMEGITAPSVALLYLNMQNEAYWKRPVWERNIYWMVPNIFKPEIARAVGNAALHPFSEEGRYEADDWLRIPKPFEMGLIFGSFFERGIESLLPQNPERGSIDPLMETILQDGMGSMKDVFAPVPTFGVPFLENWRNEDWNGIPLVSPYDNISPGSAAYKGAEGASPLSRQMALILNEYGIRDVSPRHLDNIVEGYTGPLGFMARQALQEAVRNTEEVGPSPAQRLHDQRLIRSFYRSGPQSMPRQVEILYDRWDRQRSIQADYDHLVEEGEWERAERKWDDNEDLMRDHDAIKGAAEEIGNLRQQMEQIRDDPTMSAEEKRRDRDEILATIGDIAAGALGWNQ